MSWLLLATLVEFEGADVKGRKVEGAEVEGARIEGVDVRGSKRLGSHIADPRNSNSNRLSKNTPTEGNESGKDVRNKIRQLNA